MKNPRTNKTSQTLKHFLLDKYVSTTHKRFFTAALALRSRGLVIGSREKEREEEEKNLQIAIRCLWDLFD